MVGELFVLFLVPLELLFLPTAQSAIYLFFVPVFKFIFALDHADIGIVLDDLRIDGIGITPAKRQVINRIQQIGLTHAVVAHKTVDFGRQFKLNLRQVFVIYDGEML